VDELEGHVSLGPLGGTWKLISFCRIFETHSKSRIVLISFGITVGGWWVWNVFLSAVYNPNVTPYGVKNGFLHQFGQDSVWWLTLALQLGILVVAYVAVKVGKKCLLRLGSVRLLMGQDAKGEIDNCGLDIEHWQELEQDASVRRELASLAKLGMSSEL
jgi:phospholipid-translocating ATPase